jgi:predicted Zn-dependent peptidase
MRHNKTILENGTRLITVPMKGNKTVTVEVMVNVGARYEDESNNGISHFLEHLQFKGTESRTSKDIVTELDFMGAEYNAFTDYDNTGYYVKTQSKNLEKALDIVSDIYKNSVIPDEEIEKERGVIIEEINMYNDDNRSKLSDALSEALYPNHPLGLDILGTKKNINKFKRQDFIDYRNKYYKGKATTLVITGDVTPALSKQLAKKYLGDLDAGRTYNPKKYTNQQKSKKVTIVNKKSDQTHLALVFRIAGRKNTKDMTPFMLKSLLSSGMSSRLFRKMRDELGICYYCYASNMATYETGISGIFAGVGHSRTDEAIEGIIEILEDIKKNGVSKKELDKVKNNVISRRLMGLETTSQVAGYYVNQESYQLDIKDPNQWIKDIKAVTPEQIHKFAKKIFDDKNATLAILGPHKDKSKFSKLLKI